MVKPRFAVAGPAVASCGLSGPHMQALRPATAKQSFTPCKGIKSMGESGVFNGLFSDYSRLFQGWTRGINLKTRGDCLLSVCFDTYFMKPERYLHLQYKSPVRLSSFPNTHDFSAYHYNIQRRYCEAEQATCCPAWEQRPRLQLRKERADNFRIVTAHPCHSADR